MADSPVALSAIRDYLEQITSTQDDSSFVDSAYELQLLNKAYQKSAYRFNWRETMVRGFQAISENVDRYDLPTLFRKFTYLRVQGLHFEETDIDKVDRGLRNFAIDPGSLEYLLSQVFGADTTAYTTSGSLTAGASVDVTVSDTDGLAAGDEIYLSDGTTSEFTLIQSVDETASTITVKLKSNHTTGKTFYRVSDGIDYQMQKIVDPLVNTGDSPILTPATHLVIPHYAAYLYYDRIEEPDRAATNLRVWDNELSDIFLGVGKSSTGGSNQLTL